MFKADAEELLRKTTLIKWYDTMKTIPMIEISVE